MTTTAHLSIFKFERPSLPIDWEALQALDLQHVIRNKDLDVLELFLDTVAHGDISSCEPGNPSAIGNISRLFQASQLIVQYLLHVQNRLAAETCSLKSELSKSNLRTQEARSKAAAYRSQAISARREKRMFQQEIRLLEEEIAAIAASRRSAGLIPTPPPAPPPPPEVRIIEKEVLVQVPVPDPEVAKKLEIMEREMDELSRQRKTAQREIQKLRETLTASMSELKLVEHKSKQATAAFERLHAQVEAAQNREQEGSQPERSLPTKSETPRSSTAEAATNIFKSELEKALEHSRQMEQQKDALQLEIIDLLRDKASTTGSTEIPDSQPLQSQEPQQPQQQLSKTQRISAVDAITATTPQSLQFNPSQAPEQLPNHHHYTTTTTNSPINKPILYPSSYSPQLPRAINTYIPPSVSSREASPTPSERRQFSQEFPHSMTTKPQVRSRFPHNSPSVEAVRQDLGAELAAEVAAGLASLGVPPGCQGLSDKAAAECLRELKRRRSQALAAMDTRDRRRAEYMRRTIKWHVGGSGMGEKKKAQQAPLSACGQAELVMPPSLPPIRTKLQPSMQQHPLPPQVLRQGGMPANSASSLTTTRTITTRTPQSLVERVVAETHDDAFYSPLRRSVPPPSPVCCTPPSSTGTASAFTVTPSSSGQYKNTLKNDKSNYNVIGMVETRTSVMEEGEEPQSPWRATHQRVMHGSIPPASPLLAGLHRLSGGEFA